MVNPLRGEIAATLDGKEWTLCLTLGALACLEESLDVQDLSDLSDKFSKGRLKALDLQKIIWAGLMGGGYVLTRQEVAEMRVEGGIKGYVDIAIRLLEATFSPPATSDTPVPNDAASCPKP